MARISGVDLPNKHVNIALTYIYGISHSSAKAICEKSKIDPMRMINDLNIAVFGIERVCPSVDNVQEPIPVLAKVRRRPLQVRRSNFGG